LLSPKEHTPIIHALLSLIIAIIHSASRTPSQGNAEHLDLLKTQCYPL